MRVNVYSEELIGKFTIIRKPEPGPNGRLFLGIRFFLFSPKELHHTETDDDRSAVTFWIPWDKATENENGKRWIAQMFRNVADKVENFKDFA
jgi:hypothetical protein